MNKKIFRSISITAIITLLVSVILIIVVLFNTFEKQLTKELADEARYLKYGVEDDTGDFFEE